MQRLVHVINCNLHIIKPKSWYFQRFIFYFVWFGLLVCLHAVLFFSSADKRLISFLNKPFCCYTKLLQSFFPSEFSLPYNMAAQRRAKNKQNVWQKCFAIFCSKIFTSKEWEKQESKRVGKVDRGQQQRATSLLSPCRDWCVIIFMLLKKHFQCVIKIKNKKRIWKHKWQCLVAPLCSASLLGGVRLAFCLLQFGCQKSRADIYFLCLVC